MYHKDMKSAEELVVLEDDFAIGNGPVIDEKRGRFYFNKTSDGIGCEFLDVLGYSSTVTHSVSYLLQMFTTGMHQLAWSVIAASSSTITSAVPLHFSIH
jgi:hypothetical protein